jgi:hypothetical protein
MPVPFLVIPVTSYLVLQAYARRGNAISSDALAAQGAASTLVQYVEESQALFGEKASAISRLNVLAIECADPNWDGNDASAINPLAVAVAEAFVRALPVGVPLPEFAPEPDGSISLDWIQTKNRLFTLSIGSNRRLAYAWLDGTDKGHAVARFDGETIPPRILEGIDSILHHGTATIKSA